MQQRSEEWYEARLGKATASRFSDVLATLRSGGEAAGRKNYRAQLVVERLTKIPADTYQNGAMQWGTDYEPMARLEYELVNDIAVEEVGFLDHKTLAAGASPDGLVGKDGLVEFKAPNSATHIEYIKGKKVPDCYMAQIQGQMWVTGRKWCDFVSYDPRMPGSLRLFIVRAERDNEFIANLEAEVTKFLGEVDSEEKLLRERQ